MAVVPDLGMISAMNTLKHIAICLLLVLLASGCATAGPQVELKGQRFTVELALTREEQARGLMFVESMGDDQGMLFVFNQEGARSFWMKNTRIALDIFYFDGDLKLVSVSENTPPCAVRQCPNYPSEGPAQYVLELNAGKAAELGVQRGDELKLLFEP